MVIAGNWMEKTQGAGRNPPCPADGMAAPLQGWQSRGSPVWVFGTAGQLGYVPPRASKRRTLVSVGLQNKTTGWPPTMAVSPAQQEERLSSSNDGGHVSLLAEDGAWVASARLHTWCCTPVGLVSLCVVLRLGAAGGDWWEMGVPGRSPGTLMGSGWFWRMEKERIGQARWQVATEALGQGPPGKHGEPKLWISGAKWGKVPV